MLAKRSELNGSLTEVSIRFLRYIRISWPILVNDAMNAGPVRIGLFNQEGTVCLSLFVGYSEVNNQAYE